MAEDSHKLTFAYLQPISFLTICSEHFELVKWSHDDAEMSCRFFIC